MGLNLAAVVSVSFYTGSLLKFCRILKVANVFFFPYMLGEVPPKQQMNSAEHTPDEKMSGSGVNIHIFSMLETTLTC